MPPARIIIVQPERILNENVFDFFGGRTKSRKKIKETKSGINKRRKLPFSKMTTAGWLIDERSDAKEFFHKANSTFRVEADELIT